MNEQSTWERVIALKSKDNRRSGVANNLTDEELECVLGTIDFFGGNVQQAYSDLSSKAKANINGKVVLFAPQYRVFDFLGMCVMGDRIGSEDATKVLVHALLKVDGNVDKWIYDLQTTDYDVDRSWEDIKLWTGYDFVITDYTSSVGAYEESIYKLVVEKMSMENNKLPTLDKWLELEGVMDAERGEVVEQLEALPYGAGRVYVAGRNGKILIEQVKG